MRKKILVIDDEEAIRDMLRFNLEQHNFDVLDASDCAAADRILQKQLPDLILLDWMLLGRSGIEFAKALKQSATTALIPIIMLTAKAEESNKVRGLDEAKVDDYITKPFSPRELVARIHAVLRRSIVGNVGEDLKLNELHLNFDKREVTIGDKKLDLSAKLFNLLYFFMTHRDKVYTRQQLLDALSSIDEFINERSVDRQVKRLRDALESYGYADYIKTVRGHGYQFSKVL